MPCRWRSLATCLVAASPLHAKAGFHPSDRCPLSADKEKGAGRDRGQVGGGPSFFAFGALQHSRQPAQLTPYTTCCRTTTLYIVCPVDKAVRCSFAVSRRRRRLQRPVRPTRSPWRKAPRTMASTPAFSVARGSAPSRPVPDALDDCDGAPARFHVFDIFLFVAGARARGEFLERVRGFRLRSVPWATATSSALR